MSDKIINKHWYAYVHGNPLSPKSYFLMNIKPGFNKGTKIAAIFAKGYAEYPDEFSPKMKTYIANALATGVPQPVNTDSPLVLLKN